MVLQSVPHAFALGQMFAAVIEVAAAIEHQIGLSLPGEIAVVTIPAGSLFPIQVLLLVEIGGTLGTLPAFDFPSLLAGVLELLWSRWRWFSEVLPRKNLASQIRCLLLDLWLLFRQVAENQEEEKSQWSRKFV